MQKWNSILQKWNSILQKWNSVFLNLTFNFSQLKFNSSLTKFNFAQIKLYFAQIRLKFASYAKINFIYMKYISHLIYLIYIFEKRIYIDKDIIIQVATLANKRPVNYISLGILCQRIKQPTLIAENTLVHSRSVVER